MIDLFNLSDLNINGLHQTQLDFRMYDFGENDYECAVLCVLVKIKLKMFSRFAMVLEIMQNYLKEEVVKTDAADFRFENLVN